MFGPDSNMWPFVTSAGAALSTVRSCFDTNFSKAARKTANPAANSNTTMYKPNFKIRIYKKEQLIHSFQHSNIGLNLSFNRVSYFCFWHIQTWLELKINRGFHTQKPNKQKQIYTNVLVSQTKKYLALHVFLTCIG